jgi:hypothetical protein
MGQIWQADDFAWPTLKLGLEHGWPPSPIADGAGGDREFTAESEGPVTDPGPPADASEHEDHDPRPTPQPREDGSL